MYQDWASGHGIELKSPKRIQNRCTKAFAEPIWKSWKCQPKPKYFEQIYLDLRSYHEKLSGKASNQLKASVWAHEEPLSKAQSSLSIGLGLSGNEKCMKMAVKWPGHFSIKFQNHSYKPKLLAWAYWAQIRAQEQKTRSKSELRLSLELMFKKQ